MIPPFPTPGAAYDRTDESQFRSMLLGALRSLSSAVAGLSGTSEFFNVRDYGAVGDGATDDSVAFAACDTAALLVDGVVLVPPGVYLIQDDTTVASPLLFAGGTIKIDNTFTFTVSGPVTALAGVWADESLGGTVVRTGDTYQDNEVGIANDLNVTGGINGDGALDIAGAALLGSAEVTGDLETGGNVGAGRAPSGAFTLATLEGIGDLFGVPSGAPAFADMANGTIAFYLDSGDLFVAVKDGGGTTGSINLGTY